MDAVGQQGAQDAALEAQCQNDRDDDVTAMMTWKGNIYATSLAAAVPESPPQQVSNILIVFLGGLVAGASIERALWPDLGFYVHSYTVKEMTDDPDLPDRGSSETRGQLTGHGGARRSFGLSR